MSAPIMSRFDLFFVVLDECNEAVDQHLATHIVGLHQNRDNAVNPQFSTEQLQRYIRFARLFQPVFTEEAKVALVEYYKQLRSDDAQGGVGRNSYRITVRQLESLIRLSEAIAKANCVDEVTPPMVEEAFKLLQQSIISVEKDDVEFEDEDEAAVAEALAGAELGEDGDSAMNGNSVDNGRASATSAPPAKPRTQITFDQYNKIFNILLRRVASDETTEQDGVEQDDLLMSYLEQIEDQLQSQEDMETHRSLARKVLKKMVKDNVLLQIRGEGLADEQGEGLEQDDKIIYVVHPNCPTDELTQS